MKTCLHSLCIVAFLVIYSADAEERGIDQQQPVFTNADAAIVIVKYSGFFEEYASEDTTLDESVVLLNKIGVYFGLKEVIDGVEFTSKDSARVLGQLHLVFSGEAEYLNGKVILPKAIDSWEDFCIMNYIDYVHGYETMKSATQVVRRFNG